MKEFKFLYTTKRPILEKVFTEEELTHISEYCVDMANGLRGNYMLKYYQAIGLVEKRFIDGELSGLSINFYKLDMRIFMRIEINVPINFNVMLFDAYKHKKGDEHNKDNAVIPIHPSLVILSFFLEPSSLIFAIYLIFPSKKTNALSGQGLYAF